VYEHLEYTPYGELWVDHAVSAVSSNPTMFRFTGKELDQETGLYYYGARYFDPKTSRWISADPAMGEYIPMAPVNDQARKHNGNLPGLGGIFNLVNMHVYHYAGNNPVVLVDPDGRSDDMWHTRNRSLLKKPGLIITGPWTYRIPTPRSIQTTPVQENSPLVLLGDRILMRNENGIDEWGPCFVMTCFGIAQSYAGKNLTLDQIHNLMKDTEIWNGSSGGSAKYIIEKALKELDINAEVKVESSKTVDPNAFSTILFVGERGGTGGPYHYQEGTNAGTFKWDPYDGATDYGRKIHALRNVYIEEF
jgi:RHS repeat-associated protein